ncbi:MAG: cyclic nucleotide-binding domain-containing protein [Candidatus Thiodiazotropha sp. (ex Semelilucina semeliformis)]|nr:cyclic nucleotide-binding domain-containing protein [Candidatus Thiodiazotropha sp. (ex Myrtea spinifera)]MCU7808739.1 cyclic nucleotide-binding domain-containing protein [Candidatus Thiodiazotropha sp. (ex Semelilucina semeliformis)]MCU7829755.1 cyclic nucleotide-binding domain-containing protein [Candidatus Thiodiazotropha sp. (ex Myrtea sp. 'scaly one' KF741663)]
MQMITVEELFEQYSLDYFKQASTFGALSETTLRWLLKEGRIVRLETGEPLFEPNQQGNSFFVILEGTVAYYKHHDGQYAFIRDYSQGEQIGFVSVVALHDRVGRAVAKQDVLVLEIDSELFYRLHKEMPRDFGLMMLNLAREMARTIRTVDNVIVELSSRNLD